MKKFNKLFAFIVVGVFAILLTGCKKANYDEYIGYQFSGKDPWKNELAITIRTLENDKLTWTFTDVYGSGEDSITIYSELSSDFKDGETSFNVKGDTDKEGYSFNYSGTLTLKDGKLIVKYTDGSLTNNSTEGGSGSYQVGALEDSNKTVTLTKVVDNS